MREITMHQWYIQGGQLHGYVGGHEGARGGRGQYTFKSFGVTHYDPQLHIAVLAGDIMTSLDDCNMDGYYRADKRRGERLRDWLKTLPRPVYSDDEDDD